MLIFFRSQDMFEVKKEESKCSEVCQRVKRRKVILYEFYKVHLET
jgi:hypothetical protein